MNDDQTAEPRDPQGGSDGQPEVEGGRREFFRSAATAAGVIGVAGALAGKFGSAPLVSTAMAQTPAQPSAQQRWWPSRWGADDEAGASNWMTPEKVLDAAKWIRTGKIYRLGRDYEQGMPLFGTRVFSLRIPGSPTGGPFGSNKLIFNDEFLVSEIGQTGTQFDGLGHIGLQLGSDGDKNEMRFYNGFTEQQIGGANGLQKLGVEKVKPFFTRGHLFDVEAVRGRMWDAGEEIQLSDLRAAMQRQGLAESDIKQGDAVFFNTGWGRLWMKNNDRYTAGEPGIGMEVARWCIERGISLTGGDTWATEVVPNPDKELAFPVHGELITKHGIFNHENLSFDELIKDKQYQFVYIFSPAAIKGATGSNGTPIAVT